MLTLDDFFKGSCSSFETKINIWKKEADLFINFQDENEKNLNNFFDIIKNEIIWIENNKNKIEDELLNNDIIELAEHTVSSAHLLKCSDEECYMIEDGSKIDFPITEEKFLESLYIESLSIDFGITIQSIEIVLICIPDYFMGQYISISIDNQKNIKFNGLNEG
ncbi:DUF2262 domain-containing protein [Methanobrevibacter sp. TMH8]|uniref:DUF2262 domain-containing protein n=1 Tax=Methanobrevibacter sp. TMH8 TaxID=2848611 RepID=UPI001CCFB2E0|nr:DUF2262 domain-containing protein [Methanobrevibacter sp. TMH8]MBZ9570699.1 DUF2262 domain-containing protein [Methanobrevibacter sp. TMH8]